MIRLYTDENVRGPVVRQLRNRDVDLLRAQDDIPPGTPDHEVLDRASKLGRVLYTEDDDLLEEAAERQRTGVAFAGVVYSHQERVSIGQAVQDLELMAAAGKPGDFADRVTFLPLR